MPLSSKREAEEHGEVGISELHVPTGADFRTIKCQASLWTPGLQFRLAKVLSHLLTEFAAQFDGEPVTPPFVRGMPPELPQLILQSADGKLNLQLGSSRLNVFREADPVADSEVTEFFHLATQLSQSYLELHQGKTGRIACVLTRIAADPHPATTLTQHFCQQKWLDKPLNRPESFELHAHKRFRLDELFEINSWVRCKTAVLNKDGTPLSPTPDLILVEQDFNSLAELSETRELSPEEISRFFDRAPKDMRSVLDLYFPEDR